MSPFAGTAQPGFLKILRIFEFGVSFLLDPLSKERDMRRIDLYQATMMSWARLDPAQRERFFRAGLKPALRLPPLQFRAWLLRRVRTHPLAAPTDPACFAISDREMALLLKSFGRRTAPP
jgi:hypothetical protein